MVFVKSVIPGWMELGVSVQSKAYLYRIHLLLFTSSRNLPKFI